MRFIKTETNFGNLDNTFYRGVISHKTILTVPAVLPALQFWQNLKNHKTRNSRKVERIQIFLELTNFLYLRSFEFMKPKFWGALCWKGGQTIVGIPLENQRDLLFLTNFRTIGWNYSGCHLAITVISIYYDEPPKRVLGVRTCTHFAGPGLSAATMAIPVFLFWDSKTTNKPVDVA